jgi:hypothetical protein
MHPPVPSLLRWFSPLAGSLSEQRVVAITLGTLREALVTMGGYRLLMGLVENMDRGAIHNSCWVRKHFTENVPYPVLPAAVDPEDLRSETLSLLQLRPFSDLRSVSPRPKGRLESNMDSRQLVSVVPWRCFPYVRR